MNTSVVKLVRMLRVCRHADVDLLLLICVQEGDRLPHWPQPLVGLDPRSPKQGAADGLGSQCQEGCTSIASTAFAQMHDEKIVALESSHV